MARKAKEIKCQFKGMEIVVKNAVKQIGHGDSYPFVADVFVNGVKAFKAYDDGWGGCLQYWDINTDLFHQLAKSLEGITTTFLNVTIQVSLDLFVSCMAEDLLEHGKTTFNMEEI